MGFTKSFMSLIMRCVRMAKYLVCLNGVRDERCSPMRGLCQGLSSLIRLAAREGSIKGAKVCGRGPSITHLLFANEYATIKGANNEQVVNILGVQTFRNLEKYLGLPNMVRKDKKRPFQILKDRMMSKVRGWSTRFLSIGGKEGTYRYIPGEAFGRHKEFLTKDGLASWIENSNTNLE
ncbi:hypothetical protein J1N35_043540 [Gossypium stocksii]|uniref:Reverse transcriptase n=1 Tax=Gossypium stocksii TaxID=47602 RepID=A0A9D3U7L3_9ROSI|nr:hypothetical protein J1N35_043540 [Gossypium stocksii]